MQFQITQIENGWLVAHPAPTNRLQVPGQQQQGVAHFCANYEEVCAYLKTVWPFTVIDTDSENN